MRYFILWACLALVYGNEITISPLNEIKSPISKGYNDIGLKIHEHETADPLTIRANIPKELLIPSVSSADKIGLNQGLRVNPYNLAPYPAEPLSSFGFENSFPSVEFGRQLSSSSIGSGVIRIPAQQAGFSSGFEPVLNFGSSFVAPLEVKQIPSFNPIIDYSPNLSKSKHFSIKEATQVDKFAFSKAEDFKFGLDNAASIEGLETVNENIKKINELPTKATYSIESVPEVASVHKTGPFVPSDIPSIPELLKIFDSKSTNKPESKAEIEKSDKEVLDLIEERIGQSNNRKENVSSSLNLKGRILDDEDSVTNENLTTESIINNTESDNLTANDNTTLNSLNGFDDLDELLNKTQALGNVIGSTGFRSSEDDEVVELDQPENSSDITNNTEDNSQDNLSNETIPVTLIPRLLEDDDVVELNQPENSSNITNTTEDNSQDNLSNETIPVTLIPRLSEDDEVVKLNQPENSSNITNTTEDNSQDNLSNETILVTPIPTLTASNFANASDILKDTSIFKAISESSELEINSSKNTTEETQTEKLGTDILALAKPLSINNNLKDLQRNISETIPVISSELVNKIDDDLVTKEVEKSSVKLTDSSLFGLRIASDSSTDLDNSTSETSSVEQLSQPLDGVLLTYGGNLINITAEKSSETLNETIKSQDSETTTSSVSDKQSNIESRIAQAIESVTVAKVLNETVTELNKAEDTSTVETSTIYQEVTPVANSSILNTLCSGKTT